MSGTNGDVGAIVGVFQKRLGAERWAQYQGHLSAFLTGRTTRQELLLASQDVLQTKQHRKLHNRLLLAMLAASFKAQGRGDGGAQGGFGSQRRRKTQKGGSQWEQLKQVVLSLPIRERMRIKAITREAGKRGLTSNVIVQTRQALVPKVPIVTGNTPEIQNRNLARTMVSVKDILDTLNAPLCTESYELPERTVLRDRMLGTAREGGVLGTVALKAADMLYLGLQFYLKEIVSAAMDNVIRTRDGGKQTLTLEDMADLFTLQPHLVEPYGSMDYLTDVLLQNDDDFEMVCRYEGKENKLTPVSYLTADNSSDTKQTREQPASEQKDVQLLIEELLSST